LNRQLTFGAAAEGKTCAPQGWTEGVYKMRSVEVRRNIRFNHAMSCKPCWQVWGSGDVVAIESRDVMQQRLLAISASEAKIDVAALFGYGSDGKQVCDDNLVLSAPRVTSSLMTIHAMTLRAG